MNFAAQMLLKAQHLSSIISKVPCCRRPTARSAQAHIGADEVNPPAFIPFALEHYQSLFEHTVDYNLADSSVKCVTTREGLTDDEVAAVADAITAERTANEGQG